MMCCAGEARRETGERVLHDVCNGPSVNVSNTHCCGAHMLTVIVRFLAQRMAMQQIELQQSADSRGAGLGRARKFSRQKLDEELESVEPAARASRPPSPESVLSEPVTHTSEPGSTLSSRRSSISMESMQSSESTLRRWGNSLACLLLVPHRDTEQKRCIAGVEGGTNDKSCPKCH